MKNKYISLIIAIVLFSVLLVGCSSAEPSQTQDMTDYEQDNNKYSTTEKVTDDKEVKNESVELEVDDTSYTNTSKNLEDYVQDGEYFDLKGYILARGASDYHTGESSEFPDTKVVFFTYNDWSFSIPLINEQSKYTNGDTIVYKNSSKYVMAKTKIDSGTIRVDDEGHSVYNNLEEILKMVMNDIDTAGATSDCPSCIAGHNYGEEYMKDVSYNHYCLNSH